MEQLLSVYRRLPGLRDVEISLDGGVIELRGHALSQQDREEALRFARELVPDVVFVDARGLVVETDVRKRFEPTYDRIREKGLDFLRFLPSLVLGLGILATGLLAAGWVGNRTFLTQRFSRNPFARNLARQAIRAVILLLALLLALDLMGVTSLVGAVLGAAGVAGIAIGFAFRDIIENYLAGILLSVRQPFALNDHVLLAGEEGRIVRLTGRETVLMTLDGNHVRIPNATVFKAVMTNYTRNPRRRFTFQVEVPGATPVTLVREACSRAMREITGILETPASTVRVREFTADMVTLQVTGWVDQTSADFGKVRSQAVQRVKEALDAMGVATPPQQLSVQVLTEERGRVDRLGDTRAPREPEVPPDTEMDSTPDTTIEDEIARELSQSQEENLLDSGQGRGLGDDSDERTPPPR